MTSAKSHPSMSEFRSDATIEKEADSFAASLLLPTGLVRAILNQSELTIERIDEIADCFNASLACTTFRSVALTDFPCAVAGIRGGEIAWMFPSESLIKAGIYPKTRFLPSNAHEPWAEFQLGVANRMKSEGHVRDWFSTFDDGDLGQVYVTEEYMPVTSMGTLLVLLTMDESDVFSTDDDE